MAYEMKEGTGTLFKNDRKEKDSHPNAKGTALIDGVEFWVSAWTKDGAKGKFQSLSFQRKEVQKMTSHNGEVYDKKDVMNHVRTSPQRSFRDELDDEIPPF